MCYTVYRPLNDFHVCEVTITMFAVGMAPHLPPLLFFGCVIANSSEDLDVTVDK